MLKDHKIQYEIEMVTLDSLVPKDHLVRKLEKAIDLSFIRERVTHLYCPDNGRPAIDPVVFFKLLLIGYIFGIRSERQLMRDVEVNNAYRWYIGYSLTQKVPDASTLSQTRRRRFSDNEIYQQIFDEIVMIAMGNQMVGGNILYTDSTHLKANANKRKFKVEETVVTPKAYLEELDKAVTDERVRQSQKPLKPKDDDESSPTKPTKISTTDPDSGYMVRDEKPKGFFYLDHRTVDSQYAIITDTHVTAGNVHDSVPYLSRLDRQIRRFNLYPYAVGLDAGYVTAHICKSLEDREIQGVMGYRRPIHRKGYLYKKAYKYDAKKDEYICPNNQVLSYTLTDRNGYKHYQSNPLRCAMCHLQDRCTSNKKLIKSITRHVWDDAKDRMNEYRLTPRGKRIYERRKETVERSFADAKELHNHRYARFRGLNKVQQQCLLSATAQNMKKIALHLWKRFLCSFFSYFRIKSNFLLS